MGGYDINVIRFCALLRLWKPPEMDPLHLIPFLTIGLLCVTNASPLSLPKSVDQIPERNMLELDKAADIRFVCPRSDTFCVPRVKCPVKNIMYDREGLRFLLDPKKFKDVFGCGAFDPTWTYVCCSTMERFEEAIWRPKPDLWFLPVEEGSAQAKDVDMSVPFPVMLPWPGFEDSASAPPNVELDNQSESSENQTEEQADSVKEVTTEKPRENQQRERSVPEKPTATSTPVIPQQPVTIPIMMPDQPLNNPRFNPNPPMPPMNIPQMFQPFPGGFDPRFSLPLGVQDPRLQHLAIPRADWVEMILIYGDGSFHRTIRDHSPMNMGHIPDGAVPMMDSQRRPTLDFSQPKVQTPPTIVAPTERSSRSRRAAAFKIPPAAGGMWKGENKTEGEGRALLPPPKAVWGAQGSGNVPIRPIPPAFGIDNERCGVSSSSGINARVLSGRKPGSQLQAETAFAEFPWHVAVVNGETGDYLCAGTIISARFVLTVAHCVRKFQLTLLFVRVGDWDLSGNGEMFPSYDVEVQNVIVHEDFFAGNLQNDIALLQLKFPLDFTVMPHVGTICLAPSSEPIYSDCIVTGWGQQLSTSDAKGDASSFSRTLKQTSQTLVTAQFCEKNLRKFLGQFYQLPKKGFVCAYDKDGKDSCFGDGGGALACLVNAPNYPKPMQYHVVGLVSWGVGCGMPEVPSAYTAIWDYLDWIRAKTSPLDPYPMANPQPLKEPNPVIMVRSNEAGTTAVPTTPKVKDFIDLAFS